MFALPDALVIFGTCGVLVSAFLRMPIKGNGFRKKADCDRVHDQLNRQRDKDRQEFIDWLVRVEKKLDRVIQGE